MGHSLINKKLHQAFCKISALQSPPCSSKPKETLQFHSCKCGQLKIVITAASIPTLDSSLNYILTCGDCTKIKKYLTQSALKQLTSTCHWICSVQMWLFCTLPLSPTRTDNFIAVYSMLTLLSLELACCDSIITRFCH